MFVQRLVSASSTRLTSLLARRAAPQIQRRSVQVVGPTSAEEIQIPEDLRGINADALEVLTGFPKEQLSRDVLIYRPPKHPMQSGLRNIRRWCLEFKRSDARWDSAIMGWPASRDPVGSLRLSFPNKEAAITFAERHGFNYKVIPDYMEKPTHKPADYSANFKHKPATKKLSTDGDDF